MIFESLQADQIDQRLGFDLSIAGTASPRLETKAHVAQHGTPGEKGFVEFLKYEDEIGRRAADLSPVHNDFAGAWNGEPGNGHEQGGLAATGRADEGNKLSGLDLTRDVFNRHGRLAAELAITLGETLDLEDGHEPLINGARKNWSTGVLPNPLLHHSSTPSTGLRLGRQLTNGLVGLECARYHLVFGRQIDGPLNVLFR